MIMEFSEASNTRLVLAFLTLEKGAIVRTDAKAAALF